MKDIVLVGGPGTGKTKLAEALKTEFPSSHYIHMARLGSYIPMTMLGYEFSESDDAWIYSSGNLSEMNKSDYIEMVIRNSGIDTDTISREHSNEFCRLLTIVFGKSIFGEVAEKAMKRGEFNIIDSVPRPEGAKYLADNGLFVANLECSFENQVRRRFEKRKGIDPLSIEEIEDAVTKTNRLYQIERYCKVSHCNINTDRIRSDDPRVMKRVIDDLNHE